QKTNNREIRQQTQDKSKAKKNHQIMAVVSLQALLVAKLAGLNKAIAVYLIYVYKPYHAIS
ncbi:hypothetical protein, partial [Pseudomonas viridiflava]|uniref:hypothetical protein n=1 Tax=Pseudomonas viridiflava TaxID=33069 RepID=UPI00196839A2